MAVRIRLKRMGKVRTPFYRIVACDSRTKRDGRVIEEIGTYNPKTEPSTINVDSERAQHWLGVGAQPSTPVAAILKLTGDWQKFKGEPGESTLKTAQPRRDKTEIFNEALKDAHGDSKSEAVTKKAAKKPESAEKTEKAEKPEKTAEKPEKKAETADEGEATASASAAASSSEGASDEAQTDQSEQSAEAEQSSEAEQAKSEEA